MRYLILVLILPLWIAGCSVKQQIDEAKTFAKCDFRFNEVRDLRLDDIDIQEVKKISDLSFKKAVRLATALTGKTIPLTLTLMIEGYNPNQEKAAMNRMEWICLIDDMEIATGAVEERIEIKPGETVDVPIAVTGNLKEIFSQKGKDTFLNKVFGLIGKDHEPILLKLKIKPTIMIGSWAMEYPGYITVEKEFTSEDGKKIRKKIKKELQE